MESNPNFKPPIESDYLETKKQQPKDGTVCWVCDYIDDAVFIGVYIDKRKCFKVEDANFPEESNPVDFFRFWQPAYPIEPEQPKREYQDWKEIDWSKTKMDSNQSLCIPNPTDAPTIINFARKPTRITILEVDGQTQIKAEFV